MYGEVLDIDRATLRGLLEDAQTQACQQRLDSVRCSDIMQRDVQTARPDDSVADAPCTAWKSMASRRFP